MMPESCTGLFGAGFFSWYNNDDFSRRTTESVYAPTLFALRFWPSSRRGTSRGRSGLIVWAALWVLLRLPVAVPDFHEVAHHHSDGVDCLYHEHLNRWHGPVNSSGEPAASHEHELATLHWHWVIPGSNVPEGQPGQDDSPDAAQDGPQISHGAGADFLAQVLQSGSVASTVDRTATMRSELVDIAGASLMEVVRWNDIPLRRGLSARFAQFDFDSSYSPGSFQPLRC